jgi:hypothetical protein
MSTRLSMARKAAAWRYWLAVQINTKNAAAPEGKYWHVDLQTYEDIPTCEEGYHFLLDTYQCVPD